MPNGHTADLLDVVIATKAAVAADIMLYCDMTVAMSRA